jgi:hypothetical protein
LEEAVESIILLVVLVTFAVVAYAYVLPLSYAQLRGAEVRSAIGVMLTFADQTVRLVEGDSTGPVDFAFPYGIFDLAANGNVSILVNGVSIFNRTHEVLRYRTDIGGYPNAYVADRGSSPTSTFFSSVDAASLVYHYSCPSNDPACSRGWSYVVSDMRVAVSSISVGGVTVLHILVIQIEPAQVSLKRGPVQLTLQNVTTATSTYDNGVGLTVTCGNAPNGSPLSSSLQVSGQVQVALEAVTLQLQF